VPQAILATVEPDGAGFALVLRARVGGAETELGRTAITLTLPITLTVFAFDDTVRAQVGEALVEAPREAIREGRVALVASGPAAFSAVSVDSLDLYRFDFSTSRYQSFAEHIQSWDGALLELAEDAMGVSSAAISDLLTADTPAIATAMQITADPQARQSLFQKWVTALALPLRQKPVALGISRWTSATGTQAFLIESPEPISFVREVSVALIQHVPQPPWHPFGDLTVQAMLTHLQFAGTFVTIPVAMARFLAGDVIVRVSQPTAGPTFAIYSAPQRNFLTVLPGRLKEVITPAPGAQPALDPLRNYPNGAIVLLRQAVPIAAVAPGFVNGHAVIDKPIAVVVFDNGPETAALLIPIASDGTWAPLTSGQYTLHLAMSRKRWREASSPDPEASYSQEQAIDLNW
jgi:hypothetical protein